MMQSSLTSLYPWQQEAQVFAPVMVMHFGLAVSQVLDEKLRQQPVQHSWQMPCKMVLHLLERGLQGVTQQFPLVRVQPGQQVEQRLFDVTFWQLGLTVIQVWVNGLTQNPVQHQAQQEEKEYDLLQFQSVTWSLQDEAVVVLMATEAEGTGCEAEKGRKTLELPVFCVIDVGEAEGVEVVVDVVDGLGTERVDADEDALVVVDGDGLLFCPGMVVGVVVGVAALFMASSCRRMG